VVRRNAPEKDVSAGRLTRYKIHCNISRETQSETLAASYPRVHLSGLSDEPRPSTVASRVGERKSAQQNRCRARALGSSRTRILYPPRL